MKFKLVLLTCVACLSQHPLRADLLGYWSADSTSGEGELLVNDQGNDALDGELVEAFYTADGRGHTGQPGDYAISFEGFDEDYAVLPATEEEFEEFTVTAWVNGVPAGDWAAIISSRDSAQPLYLGFMAGSLDLAYVWNDNSNMTWAGQAVFLSKRRNGRLLR